MTLLLGGLFAEDLEVDEVIYAEVALRLHIPKAKVLKCIEATMKVFAWALSERKNFDFVFKNIGILVCREGSVIMRFFEDLLRDMDKTGKLANAFLQVSVARFQCTLYPLARGQSRGLGQAFHSTCGWACPPASRKPCLRGRAQARPGPWCALGFGSCRGAASGALPPRKAKVAERLVALGRTRRHRHRVVERQLGLWVAERFSALVSNE